MGAAPSMEAPSEEEPQNEPTANESLYATSNDVFTVVELLQRILDFLPRHDLLAATRVCRYFHSAAGKSPALRKTLAFGLSRHYSDRAPSAWTFYNVQHNIPVVQSKPAGHFLFPTPVLVWRLEDLNLFTVQLKGKAVQARFLWHGFPERPWSPPYREEPIGIRQQRILEVVADQYISSPPLPCTFECLREPKREVVVRRCTIGELVRLAVLLHSCEPERWSEEDRKCLWKSSTKAQQQPLNWMESSLADD